jgi:protein subunit release factor A
LAEAEALLKKATKSAAAAGRPSLERRRAELLKTSQAPDFWDDPDNAAKVLRDYRELDAQLTDLDRVARACNFARRLVQEARGEQHLASAARAVEEVAREVQLLEARAASGTTVAVDEVLLEIEAAGESSGAQAWVRELAFMYLGWAERRGYEASEKAEGLSPTRVLLRIGGPGVLGFLAGEAGLHRRIEANGRVGAYVRLRRWPTSIPDTALVTGREVRRRPGFFVERLGAEASARDESSGRSATLLGAGDSQELKQLAAALLSVPSVPAGEVRRYFVDHSVRVEDPRTGASTPRIKDVLRGELELFIASWLSRGEEQAQKAR